MERINLFGWPSLRHENSLLSEVRADRTPAQPLRPRRRQGPALASTIDRQMTVLLPDRIAAANDIELCPRRTRWQQLVFPKASRTD